MQAIIDARCLADRVAELGPEAGLAGYDEERRSATAAIVHHLCVLVADTFWTERGCACVLTGLAAQIRRSPGSEFHGQPGSISA